MDRGNWCVYDPNFITCYQTCSSNFCNDGNPDPEYLPEVSNADIQQKTIEAIDNSIEILSEYGDIKPVPPENYQYFMEDVKPYMTSLPASFAAPPNSTKLPPYDVKVNVKKHTTKSTDENIDTKISRHEFQSAEAEPSSGNMISGSFVVIIVHMIS